MLCESCSGESPVLHCGGLYVVWHRALSLLLHKACYHGIQEPRTFAFGHLKEPGQEASPKYEANGIRKSHS